MGRSRSAAQTAALLGSLAATLFARPARAADAEVTSDTAAQFYDMRSPAGDVVVARRRVTTTLGVGVYDLLGNYEAGASGHHALPEVLFRARLRYDADYGAGGIEADPGAPGRLVPGFDPSPVDLMYAYVEGRRLFHGVLGFKLGRQYVTDALGWWAFDGGTVRVTTPFYVAVEGYAGLEVRGGMPMSTSRWERDGVWRGNRAGYDPALHTAFQAASIAPAYGAAIESTGLPWLHGRLMFRRVHNTGSSNASMFSSGAFAPVSYDGMRISQERLAYSVDASAWKHGTARAGVSYDLYVARVANAYAGIDAFVTPKLTVSGAYDYYQPTFDGDAIWSFFPSEPMNDVGVRATYDATPKLSIAGGAHLRAFGQATGPSSTTGAPNAPRTGSGAYYPSNGAAFNEGAELSARYLWGDGRISFRGAGDFGDGGQRVGGDVAARRVLETRYVVEGRASLWQWNDKLRPDRNATSFAYTAGVGYKLAPRAQAMIEWDHVMNRLAGQRLRVMLTLTFAVAP